MCAFFTNHFGPVTSILNYYQILVKIFINYNALILVGYDRRPHLSSDKDISQVSVIGGSGFLGTRLSKLLESSNQDFQIVDLRLSKSFGQYTRIADIISLDSLRKSVKGNAIIHLAAVHRDDVRPVSLYYETNVEGTKRVCEIAEERGIQKIIFTSTVAVYGFAEPETGESGKINPFNNYGRTKYEAELVLRAWQKKDSKRSLTIVRPTVIFGEGNRGNVFNLLKQIHSGRFLMIGPGENKKSMAYIENITAFLQHCLSFGPGTHVYNYIDNPDYSMNQLVSQVRKSLFKKDDVGLRLPLWMGLCIGYLADAVSGLTKLSLPISSIRVKKFTSNTSFSATAAHAVEGFVPPVTIHKGLENTLVHEFITPVSGSEEFFTE